MSANAASGLWARTRVAVVPAEESTALTRTVLTLGGRLRRPRILRGERVQERVKSRVIATDRLVLRPHRRTDADDWFALQSDRRVVRYIDWPQRTRAQSRRHLRDRRRHTRLVQAGDFLALAIEHDGHLIGDVSLHLRDVRADERTAEIGWVMHPDAAGQGLATEAARAMLDFAFDTLHAQTVMAVVDVRNDRSIALARRLGFADAGHQRGELVMRLEAPADSSPAAPQRIQTR